MATRRTALTTRTPSLLDDFDEIFRNFRTGMEDILWPSSLTSRMPRTRLSSARMIPMDLRDLGDVFLLEAELPGVPKENLDIEVTEDGVQIRAEVTHEEEEETGNYYVRERAYNQWYRRIPFPAEVVPNDAEAELHDGVLTLRVPKQEPTQATQGTKVQVK